MNRKLYTILIGVIILGGLIISIGYAWRSTIEETNEKFDSPTVGLIHSTPSTYAQSVPPSWKIWTWGPECGNFAIKYLSDWQVRMAYSGELGCNGEIFYFPHGFSSFDVAGEGAVMKLSYSQTSAVAQTTARKIEEKITNSPGTSLSFAILQCVRETNDIGNFVFIECYVSPNQAIYIVGVDIRDTPDKKYENLVYQMLSTFEFSK